MGNEITSSSTTESRYCTSITESVNKVLDTINQTQQTQEKKDSLKTGFGNLVFNKNELIILSARPYIGKSAFAFSLIKQMCLDSGQSVGLIIPGNIDDIAVSEKLLSMCSQIPSPIIRNAVLDDEKITKIQDAAKKITEAPLYVMNIPNCSLSDIQISIKSMVEKSAQLIVIEGFEFIKEIVDSDPEWYRTTVEDMLVNLKDLAKDFNVPIMVVIDLPEAENYYEPRLTDFKKCMIIPKVADKVLFIHRERSRDICQDVKLVIAKNNNGFTGDIALIYNKSIKIFTDKEKEMQKMVREN